MQLKGSGSDFDMLIDACQGASWQIVNDEQRGFVLRSDRFNELDDEPKIREAANRFVEFVNRAARVRELPEYDGIEVAAVICRSYDGETRYLRTHDTILSGNRSSRK